LDNLKWPITVATEIPAIVILDKIKGKFNNWKETTSTSPITKQHLGHYQCLAWLIDQEKENNVEPDAVVLVLRAKKILNAHFLLVAYLVKFGISLTQWQNEVNSVIEKEPGSPRIHWLQVIHLYEANYNLILSIFWARKLVPQAEQLRLFNSFQCYWRNSKSWSCISAGPTKWPLTMMQQHVIIASLFH
jgi:hypothetical protein